MGSKWGNHGNMAKMNTTIKNNDNNSYNNNNNNNYNNNNYNTRNNMYLIQLTSETDLANLGRVVKTHFRRRWNGGRGRRFVVWSLWLLFLLLLLLLLQLLRLLFLSADGVVHVKVVVFDSPLEEGFDGEASFDLLLKVLPIAGGGAYLTFGR